MNFLLVYWRYVAVVGLVAVVLGYTYRIGGNGPRADLKAYKAQIASEAETQRIKTVSINDERVRNLEKVNHDLLQNVQAANDLAVANAKSRRVCFHADTITVPGTASGQQGNASATGESVAADEAFISACGRDAARLNAWIDYATLNQLPVR